jgi:hypothetical protein
MASTYSQYKIELVGTGEQAGTWGTTTNNNFGSATPGTYQGFEQAIGGRADVTMSGTTTLSLTNSNAAQDARALYLNLSGTLSGAADLVVPALQKSYLVKNGTTGGFAVTIKVIGQTGVSIPNGKTVWVYNNGTDVVTAVDFIPEIATTTVDATNIEVTNIKAKDGSAAVVITDSTGAVAVSTALTANGGVVFNDAGADVDFRVEGDTEANLLFVDASADKVGIGTSSPSASYGRLTVAGTGITIADDGNAKFQIGRYSAGVPNSYIKMGANSDSLRFSNPADSADLMTLDSSGRVGIGTSSPDTATLLTVDGAMTILGPNTGHGASRLKLGQDTTAISQIRFYGADNSTPGILQFTGSSADGSVGGERMRIDSSGNVGIGTTSPSYPLHVIKNQAATTSISVDNNTGDAASHASLILHTGGASSGDPFVYFYNEITDWSIGCDNSDSDKFKISKSSTLGTNDYFNIDSSGNVGIGTSSPAKLLNVGSASGEIRLGAGAGLEITHDNAGDTVGEIKQLYAAASALAQFKITSGFTTFHTGTSGTERMRLTSIGDLYIGRTSDTDGAGLTLDVSGFIRCNRDGATPMVVNRNTDDGALVSLRQAGAEEGSISVSGTTVSYNGGHLSRWAQMLTKPDLLKGTVMSNLDEMNVYVKPTLYWTEEDELPVDEEGNPTVAVGDVKEETSVSDNEQLNKVKVSDVEGDPNVAGVFVNWTYDEAHQVDEINMAMTGDMIIRIAEGVTVARGDLLMSAGDGTAKPQGDDIVRSKTIAKVTSTHVTCTYEDGSYCVPCVLMAC